MWLKKTWLDLKEVKHTHKELHSDHTQKKKKNGLNVKYEKFRQKTTQLTNPHKSGGGRDTGQLNQTQSN